MVAFFTTAPGKVYRPIALMSQILRVSSRCSLTISVQVQPGVDNLFLCLGPQIFFENVPAKCLHAKCKIKT